MSQDEGEVYGPFRSEETYELIGWGYEDDSNGIKDFDSVVSEAEESINPETYDDLVEVYGEEKVESSSLIDYDDSHLSDIQDGIGCTEIWEKLSSERNA